MKINIYKKADGSLEQRLGDDCLFYTNGCSDEANSIASQFMDSEMKLSPNYASIVWKYYRSEDRYMLIHVQGQQVVNLSQARSYTFRGAYEVSRKDMNALNTSCFPIGSVIDAMPRIEKWEKTCVRLEEATDINIYPGTSSSENLKNRILKAFLKSETLNIRIPSQGTSLKENGIFRSQELKTLLATIENLPIGIARYASFAFCIDENYDSVLSNVLIRVHSDKSNAAGAEKAISWSEAVNSPCTGVPLDIISRLADTLPGQDEKLDKLDNAGAVLANNIERYRTIVGKSAKDVASGEWDVWLKEHTLRDISVSTWQEFGRYKTKMPSKYHPEFIEIHRGNALTSWPIADDMRNLIADFNFSKEDMKELQDMAVEEFIDSDFKQFYFLYDGYDYDFSQRLTGDLLKKKCEGIETSELSSKLDSWWEKYNKYGCLKKASVRKEFKNLIYKVELSNFDKAKRFVENWNRKDVDLDFKKLNCEKLGNLHFNNVEMLPSLDSFLSSNMTGEQRDGFTRLLKDRLIAFKETKNKDYNVFVDVVSSCYKNPDSTYKYVLELYSEDEICSLAEKQNNGTIEGLLQKIIKLRVKKDYRDLAYKIYRSVASYVSNEFVNIEKPSSMYGKIIEFWGKDKKIKYPLIFETWSTCIDLALSGMKEDEIGQFADLTIDYFKNDRHRVPKAIEKAIVTNIYNSITKQ